MEVKHKTQFQKTTLPFWSNNKQYRSDHVKTRIQFTLTLRYYVIFISNFFGNRLIISNLCNAIIFISVIVFGEGIYFLLI